MTRMHASEAKNKFGQLLDLAQRSPVTIEKKGRPVAVVLSLEDYKQLEELEDQAWAIKALQAKNEGFVGKNKSADFLEEVLKDARD